MDKSKSQFVHDYIERKILNHEFEPGTKIPSEAILCKKLDVSRVTVRTGVEKLIAVGLLTKQKNGSTYVSKLSDSNYLSVFAPTLLYNVSYIEMLELRQALDALSISLCIKNIDKDGLSELRDILIKMEEFEQDDSFFKLDKAFHLAVSKSAKNTLLHNMNEVLWDVLERGGRGEYHTVGNKERIVEHERILSAVINKDEDLARIYSVRHLERTIEAIRRKKV